MVAFCPFKNFLCDHFANRICSSRFLVLGTSAVPRGLKPRGFLSSLTGCFPPVCDLLAGARAAPLRRLCAEPGRWSSVLPGSFLLTAAWNRWATRPPAPPPATPRAQAARIGPPLPPPSLGEPGPGPTPGPPVLSFHPPFPSLAGFRLLPFFLLFVFKLLEVSLTVLESQQSIRKYIYCNVAKVYLYFRRRPLWNT